MSFLKLAKKFSVQQPFFLNVVKTIKIEKMKFASTLTDYNDPSKYELITNRKFYPFLGWIEFSEYIKK